MDLASSTRAAENRTRWKGIVANSSVVPRRPSKVWNRVESRCRSPARTRSDWLLKVVRPGCNISKSLQMVLACWPMIAEVEIVPVNKGQDHLTGYGIMSLSVPSMIFLQGTILKCANSFPLSQPETVVM